MHVNISNEFKLSDIHGAMNHSGLVATLRASFTSHATLCGSYM